MRILKAVFTFYLLLFTFYSLKSQSKAVGTWRYYFNTQDYFDLENVEGNIFVNAKRVVFDLKLNPEEVLVLDKTNGLSDYNLATMAYNRDDKRLIIAYGNTMLDVISFENGYKKITPNYDVFNKLLVADKTIQKIKFFDGVSYLCSKIGIVVFDYKKNEIKATYIVGDNGNNVSVMTLEKFNSKYFAATPFGVKEASDNVAINLQDFSNWNLNTSAFPIDSFFNSAQNSTEMYFISKDILIATDGVNSAQIIMPKDGLRVLKRLKKIGQDIFLLYDSLNLDNSYYSTKIINVTSNLNLVYESIGRPIYDIEKSNDGRLYLSGRNGLARIENNLIKSIGLSSNPYDYPFRLQMNKEDLYVNMGVMARNLDAGLNPTGMFVINNSYIYLSGLWNDSFYDCTNQISAIELNGGLYRAFVRGGITFEKASQPVKKFNSSNSKLEENSTGYRASDMVLNPKDGSLWIVNFSSNNPLKCLAKNGTWYSFDLSSVTSTKEIYKIVIDSGGSKWLLTRQDGLIMFNEKDINNPLDDIIRRYTEIPRKKNNSCETSLLGVHCAALDKDGYLWLGTDKGVGYAYNCTYDPESPCEFDIPIQTILNPNDTTQYQECAFLNTPVTAMAIDAGNNLWVGTPDGVFYNAEAMELEYLKFNKLNSPFSAKSVLDIAIDPDNGEIFFSTEIGLLSYIGQSISGEKNAGRSPYLVIPNPVPSGYEGLITIDGIPENAFYKITDVVGNLVYQGQSNGSRVTWDGRSLSGAKASTGVYFIFSGLRELRGSTGVGKFTIIR